MPVLLVDLDDVLFPYAHTYRQYRARHGLAPIDDVAWSGYRFDDQHIDGHSKAMTGFFDDPWVIATPPVSGRAASLKELSRTVSIIACTGRHPDLQKDGTLAWVDRWLPWLAGVELVGYSHDAPSGEPKARIARKYDAIGLIDDTPLHLECLPQSTQGLLVTRPAGVPSAPGAGDWAMTMRRVRHRLSSA